MFYFSENVFPDPLTIILNQNKLTGKNYIDWKRNALSMITFQVLNFYLRLNPKYTNCI